MLSDRFAFSTPKLCKNKGEKNLLLDAEQSSMFHISADAKDTHLQKGCNIRTFINIYTIYTSKYHSSLSIYTSGFIKHMSIIGYSQ